MDRSAFDLDQRVRLVAFGFSTQQSQLSSDGVLPCAGLATGFMFGVIRVPLTGPQGISRPAIPSNYRNRRQSTLVVGPTLHARKGYGRTR